MIDLGIVGGRQQGPRGATLVNGISGWTAFANGLKDGRFTRTDP
ncbi:hypothetical protein ACTFTM_09720 [Micromonospora sp. RB23]